MGLVVLGFANVWQVQRVQTGAGVPPAFRLLGAGPSFGLIPNSLIVFVPLALLDPARAPPHRLRAPALRHRRQPDRRAAVRRPVVAGPSRPVRAVGRCWPASPGSLIAGLDQRGQRDASSTRHCCHRWRPRSSAARRSWAAGAAIGGTIVGALILTGAERPAERAGLPGGRPPDPLRRDHHRCRRRVHADHPSRLSGGSMSPIPSRHLGIDLGGTNLKWAVVEQTGDAWSTVDSRPGADATADARTCRRRRRALGGGGGGRDPELGPAIATSAIGVPGLYDPAAGTTRFLVNIPGEWDGQPDRGRGRRRARPAHGPHQRRARVRPRRAAARCRPRRDRRWSG